MTPPREIMERTLVHDVLDNDLTTLVSGRVLAWIFIAIALASKL